MSVFETSFLVIDIWLPKIRYSGKCITVRTCFLLQLVTLFSTIRKVDINATTGKIIISTRNWWFVNTIETIPIANIRYVDVSAITVGTSPGYTPDGMGWRDQQENFIPYLMTVDGKRIDLVSFYGEGTVHTGWWGVLLGDQIIDFKGRQEKRAREFTERVATLIGVSVGFKSKILADTSSIDNKVKCTSCGHFNVSSNKKCLYCGAVIANV